MVYRTPGGKGVRLDGGPGYAGASILPHYDSLLTKIITHGSTRRGWCCQYALSLSYSRHQVI